MWRNTGGDGNESPNSFSLLKKRLEASGVSRTRKNSFGKIGGAQSRRRERRPKRLILLKKGGGGAGICTYSAVVSKVFESGAFLVKPLIEPTFDAFIDSSGLHPSAPKSAAFVEVFWRRREPVPAAGPRSGTLLAHSRPIPMCAFWADVMTIVPIPRSARPRRFTHNHAVRRYVSDRLYGGSGIACARNRLTSPSRKSTPCFASRRAASRTC